MIFPGWTLICGFLTMMIADDLFATCSSGSHGHSHGLDQSEIESMSQATSADNHKLESEIHQHDNHQASSVEKRRNTITLGLIIHNAMDGLAMGAAKSGKSSTNSTQAIVFWAIMMHHLPAAFGYATYLRNSGLEEPAVRRYLVAFSLAAPIAAALSYIVLHPDFLGIFSYSNKSVGICLLFSAGTFLNVACVHALEEAKRGFPKWTVKQVLVLAFGAVVPGIVSWNHTH
jgi:zinc transporter 9